MEVIVSFAFLLHALCFTLGDSGTIQYANIGENVILICQQPKGAKNLRWLRDNVILTDGHEMNELIPWHTLFTINLKKDESQYNLMIDNVTADDFGVYLCEMQFNKQVSQQQVTLTDKDFCQVTTSKPASSEFKRMTETTFPSDVSNTRNILTTLSNTENTVSTIDQKFTYELFAAGFVAVLLVSIGCNICISNYRNRLIQSHLGQPNINKQNVKNPDESIQEIGSIDEISNVSSKYETINEHDLAVLHNTSHGIPIQAQSFNQNISPLFEHSYLEVIADDAVFTEETIESPSKSKLKMKTLNSEEQYTYDIDAEVDSHRSINLENGQESNISSSSSTSSHVDIECVNKLIDRKIFSTKKNEFINPYSTLITSEMYNCQSYYTTIKPDTKSSITTEKPSFKAIKRHSCP